MATPEELPGSAVTTDVVQQRHGPTDLVPTSYRITPVDWSDTTVASVVDAIQPLSGVLRITTPVGD